MRRIKRNLQRKRIQTGFRLLLPSVFRRIKKKIAIQLFDAPPRYI